MKDLLDWLAGALMYVFPIVTAMTAIGACFVAYFQYKLNSDKLRLDLYDRRYSIYNATIELILHIVQKECPSREAQIKFLAATSEKSFLFGSDISKYIDTLYTKSCRIQEVSRRLSDMTLEVGQERSALADEHSSLWLWFTEQRNDSEKLFSKYLSFRCTSLRK